MKVPQIRMTSELAQIRIEQTRGKQEILQRKADLSIEQPKAELSIETSPSKLTIDQTEAWEQMDRMSILRRTEKLAQDGKSALLEGIARRAEQGSELMRIENKGNPIATQAVTNGYSQMKSLGITFIPSPFSVKINYEPSKVKINAKVNKPIIDAVPNNPEHYYERGSVIIDMEKYASLNVDFVNLFSESI